MSKYISRMAWKVSVTGVLLVRIFPHSDWIQRDTVNIQSECLKIWTRKNPNTGTFQVIKMACLASLAPRIPAVEKDMALTYEVNCDQNTGNSRITFLFEKNHFNVVLYSICVSIIDKTKSYWQKLLVYMVEQMASKPWPMLKARIQINNSKPINCYKTYICKFLFDRCLVINQ